MENPLTDLPQKPLVGAIAAPLAPSETRPADARCDWRAFARARLDSLTKPLGSLGHLEEIAAKIVCIREQERPGRANKAVYVFAADHGVTEEGVSAYPKDV